MRETKRLSGKHLCLLAAMMAAVPAWHFTAQAQSGAPAKKSTTVKASGIMLISRERPDPVVVERGKTLYLVNCANCHGEDAAGENEGPNLIRSELALDDERGNRIGPVIRWGRGTMPAFDAFTNEQIQDVAAYLRERQIATIDRGGYEIQNVATGDAERGRTYFNGAGGCNACHSPTGNLAGIAKKYEEEPYILQVRFLNPRTSRPTIVTVTNASGESVSGRLIEIDDFEVSLRDSTGAKRTLARAPGVKVKMENPLERHRELLKTYTDEIIHDVMAYLVTLK